MSGRRLRCNSLLPDYFLKVHQSFRPPKRLKSLLQVKSLSERPHSSRVGLVTPLYHLPGTKA